MKKLLFVVSALMIGLLVNSCINEEPKVTVQEIQLNYNEMAVRINQHYQLIPSFIPKNSYYTNVVWSSSNPQVATVNENGMVSTTNQPGLATIICTHPAATEYDHTVSDTCLLKVKPTTIKSITLNKTSYTTQSLGDDLQLEATIQPDTAKYTAIEWISSNPLIATVNEKGLVHFLNEAGNVEITALHKAVTPFDDEMSATCKILVEPILMDRITLNITYSLLLAEGKTLELHAQVFPSNATYQDVVWTSSNPSIATVSDKGLVTTMDQVGTVIITAKHPARNELDVEKSTTCTIEVVPAHPRLDMIMVEGGTFQMGGTAEQGSDATAQEKPVHDVTLSTYSISKTEITQAQYLAIMDLNPSLHVGGNLPVENVNYNQAVTFCQKLSEKTGETYQLPTEAQWEYAARGGKQATSTKYSGSNDLPQVAWYKENANSKSHPVASKEPNALGIYDMSGNLMEYCSDFFADYSADAQTNPTGPSSGSKIVIRGGSYSHADPSQRVSYREGLYKTRKGGNIGFRVVKVVK